MGVAGEEAGIPAWEGLFLLDGSFEMGEVGDVVLVGEAFDQIDEEGDLFLPAGLHEGEPLELGQFWEEGVVDGLVEDGGLEVFEFALHLGSDRGVLLQLFEIVEAHLQLAVILHDIIAYRSTVANRIN